MRYQTQPSEMRKALTSNRKYGPRLLTFDSYSSTPISVLDLLASDGSYSLTSFLTKEINGLVRS